MLWMADGLRIHADKPHFLLLICSVVFTGAQHNNRLNYFDRVESYTNICPLGHHHKDNPSAEPGLVDFCYEWSESSCCTADLMRKLRAGLVYNFDHSHCNKTMSEKCEAMFMQDLCIYQCSPNLGPWLVRSERKVGIERMYAAPLCMSDCNDWWEACRHELTCVENWSYEFDWSTGRNKCPQGRDCLPFEKVYGNASQFCHAVWDGSWTATNSSQCLHLLKGKVPSILKHNHDVAVFQANLILKRLQYARSHSMPQGGAKILTLLIAIGLIQFQISNN
ncbi:Folate receptor beta [Fasciolopsis buskii]|uniref:Folate receptor beta n=1 Tax=Fasciolopsis buskii TaxID=27845 RepID=A0A8E0S0B3_9TREM|nr:Folate receptor beta [Fasciolopsis buski]